MLAILVVSFALIGGCVGDNECAAMEAPVVECASSGDSDAGHGR